MDAFVAATPAARALTRRGSASRNLKTRARFKNYDDAREDRYSLPKIGKMLMGNRDLGPHDQSKAFTDKLGPVKRWLDSQVGRNWDRVYSEIKQAFPNTNKQNLTCWTRT
jgi:hypothetical protein